MWSVTSTGIVTYVYTKADIEREARILAARILIERQTIIVSSSR